MIRKILVFIVALLPVITSAQTIHWLTFIDTTSPPLVGDVDKNSRKVLYSRVINEINTALKEKGYSSDIVDVYGTAVSPEACKEIVSSLRVQPEDIVVFYYIGHGTHGMPGGEEWPMMCMAQADPRRLVPLKWVHDQLMAKGARLTVTVGMCCNSYENINRIQTPTFATNYGNVYMDQSEVAGLQKLFLENVGDILITAAQPGEVAGIVQRTQVGDMDTFSYCFMEELKLTSQESNPTWDMFFESLSESMITLAENSPGNVSAKHSPAYKINTRPASMPTARTKSPINVNQPQPKKQTAKPTGDREWLNKIGEGFDIATNHSVARSTRGVQIENIKSIFTNDAQVKVVSQDGGMVINTVGVNDYLMQLVINDSLIKVTPLSIKKIGDKISEIRVNESYLKN